MDETFTIEPPPPWRRMAVNAIRQPKTITV
jgi:hypothetical protein